MKSGCGSWPPGACASTRATESTRKAWRITAVVAFIAQLSHNATSMKSSPCPRYTQSSRSTLAESTEVIHTHPLIPNCFDEIDHSNSSTSELLDNAVVGDGLAYKGREVLHKAPIEG